MLYLKNQRIEIEKKDKGDYSLIGIHATILSIIITFLSAYGLFVFGNLDELEYQTFSEYSKINDIYLASRFKSPRHQFKDLLLIPSNLKYKTVSDNIWRIASEDIVSTTNKIKPTEIEIAEKGIELLCNMTVLQNIYPYATRLSFDPEGEVIYNDDVQKLRLSSIDEIRNWVNDIDYILKVILFFYTQRKDKLDELISAATSAIEKKFPPFESEKELNQKLSPGDKNDLLRMRSTLASNIANKFFQNIAETQKIFINTKKLIEDHDLYNIRHINKTIFSIGLILTFFAFISSVILPLIVSVNLRLIEVWIPITTYLVIFSYLIIKILFL